MSLISPVYRIETVARRLLKQYSEVSRWAHFDTTCSAFIIEGNYFMALKWARYDKIMAFKMPSGQIVGFHGHNMQVAQLDNVVWEALLSPGSSDQQLEEAKKELSLWNQEIDPRATDADLELGVRSISINIAQICNLKCGYCAAGGDGTFGDPIKVADLERLQEQIRMLLHDVPQGEEFTLTFFGGEPLVAPEAIRSIARYARLQVAGRGIKLRFIVITNGTLITAQNAELLASLNANVIISLDGPPEVNDKSRPTRSGKGSTALTLKGLRTLMTQRHRLGFIHVGAVFGKHHTGVLETYKFLREFDFDLMKFDFAVEESDSALSEKYTEELLATAELAYQLGGEKELRRLHMFDTFFRILDQKKRIQNHCGAGKSHLQIDGRGRITTCQWFVNDPEEQVGEGLNLDHAKLSHYQQRLTELNDCRSCWAKHLCGGGCMYINKVKTGSKHKVDNDFCTRTKNTIAKAIEIYAEARSENQGVRSEIH